MPPTRKKRSISQIGLVGLPREIGWKVLELEESFSTRYTNSAKFSGGSELDIRLSGCPALWILRKDLFILLILYYSIVMSSLEEVIKFIMTASPKLDESSPSVQTHLGIIQGVIYRMAANSTQCKAWCITIVSAILVIIADKGNPDFAWIALLPTTLFMFLDTYYLTLEKGFRESYNSFVKSLHAGDLSAEDLYSVEPSGNTHKNRWASLLSFSIWGFYLGLIVLIVIARNVVLV